MCLVLSYKVKYCLNIKQNNGDRKMKTVKKLIHLSASANTPLGKGVNCKIAGFKFQHSLKVLKSFK